MLAAVCADQRRASVLHRRFPLAETRTAPSLRWKCWALQQARPHRGDAVARRPEAAHIALALVLDPKVLARRTHRRDGHRRALRMIDKVHELWERQRSVVFIEHDMDTVFKIAPEIVVLCRGRILATGCPMPSGKIRSDRGLSRHRNITPRRRHEAPSPSFCGRDL
jgi:branched-chain amino acid transport system ATP-binding protein